MTLRSGLAASVGFAAESTVGTAVAPTIHVPLVSESLKQDIARLESKAIIAGQRILRSQQWAEGAVTASGDVGMELNDLTKGLLLRHMVGFTDSIGPFTPGDLTGLGLTVQVGVPDSDAGTVHPKTLAGGKITSWEIACAVGEIATLGLSFVGKQLIHHRSVADGVTTNTSTSITSATAAWVQDDVGKPIAGTGIPAAATIASVESATAATLSAAATATGSALTFVIGMALTAASYTAGIAPMSYVGGSLTIGGTATKVTNLTLSGDNGYATDRRFVGQRTIDESLEASLRKYGGTIATEYFSDVAYRRFVSGAEYALSATIARGSKSLIAAGNVRFDGETPVVGGPGIVGQNLPFVFLGTTTDASALTFTLDET